MGSPVGRPPALLLGKTAEKWAQALGVTRRSVQRWIAHTSSPDLATAARMADLAGVTLDEVAVELLERPSLQRQPDTDPGAEP